MTQIKTEVLRPLKGVIIQCGKLLRTFVFIGLEVSSHQVGGHRSSWCREKQMSCVVGGQGGKGESRDRRPEE